MRKKLFTIAPSGNALGVHYLLFTIIALVLVSCGYKPSSHLIKNVFSDNIYVEVIVDRVEPENAPFIKDEMNRLIYTRFKGRVTSKEKAESQIRISYEGSSILPLAFKNGFVVRYRTTVRTHYDMLTKDGKLSKDIIGVVEADIQASALTSNALRIEAIRIGLARTLDEFMAFVSAKGMLKSVGNK